MSILSVEDVKRGLMLTAKYCEVIIRITAFLFYPFECLPDLLADLNAGILTYDTWLLRRPRRRGLLSSPPSTYFPLLICTAIAGCRDSTQASIFESVTHYL